MIAKLERPFLDFSEEIHYMIRDYLEMAVVSQLTIMC